MFAQGLKKKKKKKRGRDLRRKWEGCVFQWRIGEIIKIECYQFETSTVNYRDKYERKMHYKFPIMLKYCNLCLKIASKLSIFFTIMGKAWFKSMDQSRFLVLSIFYMTYK